MNGTDLDTEIAAYEAMRGDLEAHRMGRWVLVHDRELAGEYDSFECAAEDAVSRFGRGPYLIRQVGAAALTLPVSVMH
ncbi:MAG TPA: hypothetical protein VOA80_05810 [Thermoanaerobaculia bacterium]|jgi:hypothetical protein|nr:hypothetical protein [Thermoanaerobaculia bacterium]